jgi:hypothetical protein
VIVSKSSPLFRSGSFAFARDIPPVVEVVARVARALWPIKTARQLAARTRKTHRAAEDWLSLRTGMSADALADLLRSDAGLAVLEGIVGPHKPSWWGPFKGDCQAAAIEARLAALRQEIDEARAMVAQGRR